MKKSFLFQRNLLPTPAEFYSQEFKFFRFKSGWVNVHCCFHEDSHPSLSLNLTTGGFHCFGCGVKGRDVLAFVMQRYQLTFSEACKKLGAF